MNYNIKRKRDTDQMLRRRKRLLVVMGVVSQGIGGGELKKGL
jgi:hypothetical protein